MEEEKILTIDFKVLFQILWKEKWRIMLISALFIILGGVYAFIAKEEFVANGKIMPEFQSKSSSLGQFSDIAALAGVDLSSMGAGAVDAVRPDLYPDVITSTPFYLELFKTKVRTKDNTLEVFEHFYHREIEDNKEPKEKLLTKYPVKEEGIIVINGLNELRLEELRERISSTIDKKSGVISISTKMPDPVVAAEVSKFAMNYLMEYIIQYRTEKLKKDVDYLADQVASSRGKYYSTQQKKASYSDQYQAGSIRLQSADVQRERIESEYRLSSSFYNELLKKYEEAKFKLHQETPVFQVLEPPVTPFEESEPKKLIILLFSGILGGIFSLAYVLFRNKNYKSIVF